MSRRDLDLWQPTALRGATKTDMKIRIDTKEMQIQQNSN